MAVKETLNEGLKREYAVELPGEEFNTIYQSRLKDLASKLNIDGFRKGKVPPMIAQQRYGKELSAEILQDMVQDAVKDIFEKNELHPVAQPKVTFDSVENPKDGIKFKVSAEIAPKIALPDFSKLELERLSAPVSKEAIDKAIDFMAQRAQTFETLKEERPAKKGDVLCVDFLGKEDGKPFEGGKGSDVNIEIGSGHFIPGFEEQIEGMKPGEKKTITVTFPEDYGAKKLAGKTVTFDIDAKALKKAKKPEINDTFAQNMGYKDLADLEGFLKEKLGEEYKQVAQYRLQDSLLEKLSKIDDFELPETLVENEFKSVWGEVEKAKKEGNLDEADKKKDDETLRDEYMKLVKRRIKLGLILAEVGRKDHVHVTQADLDAAIKAEAARYPGMVDKFVEYFSKSQQARNALVGEIYQDKVVEYILSHAQVKDKEVTSDELLSEK